MRRLYKLALVLVILTYLFPQQTMGFSVEQEKKNKINSYGGLVFNISSVHKGYGFMLGGKGGILVNKRFGFGGLGLGMLNKVEVVAQDPTNNIDVPLDMSMGYGGVFFEYFISSNGPIQISIPFNAMVGGLSIEEQETKHSLELHSIFILEPGLRLRLKITDYFQPSIGISYKRFVGADSDYLSNNDLSGLSFSIHLDFGSF